jgi:hypothetical protein
MHVAARSVAALITRVASNGNSVPLKFNTIFMWTSVQTPNGPIYVDDVTEAELAAEHDEVVGGPILSNNNELVGFAFAGFDVERGAELKSHHVLVSPWATLSNAMSDARVVPAPSWTKGTEDVVAPQRVRRKRKAPPTP